MTRRQDWPADLDKRAAEDMARHRTHTSAPIQYASRTTIPAGAKRVVRIDGKPTRQRVMTLRPLTENQKREIYRSESEGRYEAKLVEQAIRAAGGEIR
jgi:hypothetical protein